jgi:ABC-type cobalamin/Fe3+-siderophores transport system ATPase subunit
MSGPIVSRLVGSNGSLPIPSALIGATLARSGGAARYADYLVAMAGGRLHTCGKPEDILNEQMVRDVFGLESRIIIDPTSGRPIMLPIGRHRMAG